MKNLIIMVSCLLFTFTSKAGKIYKVTTQDEFKKAAEVVKAGDEIVIANGNYSGWELVINTNGTADKNIIIRAEKTGKVVFSGDANKPIFQLTGSYTTISGLTFSGCNVFRTKDANGYLI